ncbi:hypothetical protein EI94DRAFT_456150 [Lactarius quietus]|nr:hypothetical protein EI94DRAFT_456150 [Lactarius quietus]
MMTVTLSLTLSHFVHHLYPLFTFEAGSPFFFSFLCWKFSLVSPPRRRPRFLWALPNTEWSHFGPAGSERCIYHPFDWIEYP